MKHIQPEQLLVGRSPPRKDGADKVKAILDSEVGKMQFIKINEDLKRLEIKMRRGY